MSQGYQAQCSTPVRVGTCSRVDPYAERSGGLPNRRMSNMVDLSGDSLGTLHRSLRAATRGDHIVVDQLIAKLDLGRRKDYARLLSIHHAVLQSLEPEWRHPDRDDFSAMSRSLQNDLRALGFRTANLQAMSFAPLASGGQLGIAYVIRGSRLGSKVLRPRIPSQFSASYFDFIPTLSWGGFLEQLQRASKEDEAETHHAAICGAKLAFDMFSRLLTQGSARDSLK
jgi:heme oxygenase